VILALKIDDRELLGCTLAALAPSVALSGASASAVGAGFFDGGDLLIAKRPGHHGPVDLVADSRGARSEVFLLSAPSDPGEAFAEERTPPIRYRQWLFADDGIALRERRASPARAQALEGVPEFLRRQLPGSGPLDLAFLLFLDQLRQGGLLSSASPEMDEVRPAFARAVRLLHAVEGDRSPGLVAAGERWLLAARGTQPLYHRRLAGLDGCARCSLPLGNSGKDARAEAHRQLKAVVVTSSPTDPAAWTELAPGDILGVSRALELGLAQ
jgi:hypothetical protein